MCRCPEMQEFHSLVDMQTTPPKSLSARSQHTPAQAGSFDFALEVPLSTDLPSFFNRKVKLTRRKSFCLPFLLLKISCCQLHLLFPLITMRLLDGSMTSTCLPVLGALAAFPLRTEPSNALLNSWNRMDTGESSDNPTTGSAKEKFSVWADIPRLSLYSLLSISN